MYEIETWCTSVILKLTNGTIIHSRNLDYENSNELRAVTYRAKFVKSGVYQYDAVMFAGTVGVYSGMKKGAFSITMNRRFPTDDKTKGLREDMLMEFSGYY